MPIQNKDNISLGIGNLELGTYTNDVFDAYADVGAIKSEVTIEHNREVLDFEAGRPLVTILQEVIRESVTVAATLAELNLATLKMALGQGNITSGTTTSFLDGTQTALLGTLQTGKTQVLSGTLFKFGGTPTHAFVGLRFTHVKANGKRQIFEGFKASPSGQLSMPFRESDWNLMAVSFRLLADTTRTAGEQYYQFLIEQ
jgi:hypothetical protein